MSLPPYDVAVYLGERGLLSLESVVGGDYVVVDRSRRNRNLKILVREAPGLFVKQVKGHDPAHVRTLEREAACYRLARDDPRFRALARLMPAFLDYDTGRRILVIELLPDSEDLWRHHQRLSRFPAEMGSMQGSLLGTFHGQQTLAGSELRDLGVFDYQIPWILSLHQSDPNYLHQVSGGNVELVRILREHADFQEALDGLRSSWSPTALIHGDVKWENLVLVPNGDRPELRLIDWEIADVGDPCWDAGAVLQAYLSFWIFNLPLQSGLAVEQAAQASAFDENEMRPAMTAFWSSYVASRDLHVSASQPLLERSMLCAAARMIQTAYEGIQASSQITPHALLQLQMSMNILRDPGSAVRGMVTL